MSMVMEGFGNSNQVYSSLLPLTSSFFCNIILCSIIQTIYIKAKIIFVFAMNLIYLIWQGVP